MQSAAIFHLRAEGVSLVIDASDGVPAVLHWGRDLGALSEQELRELLVITRPALMHDSPDSLRRFSIWPSAHEGWVGTPALEGHIGQAGVLSRARLTGVTHEGGIIRFALTDDAGLDSVVTYELEDTGLLRLQATLTRTAGVPDPLDLAAVNLALPLPARAAQIVDFTGKWTRERSPQRMPVVDGTHLREVRRGKPGPDTPLLSMVGTDGFGFGHGELWAMHIAFSGNQRWFVERLPERAGSHAAILGGGELLAPGEIRLGVGESYTTPELLFGWSDAGMDGVARRFHERLRRASRHSNSPRPLTLNTWEAVYFDTDLVKLTELADLAAGIGVERYVLDDGWFRGRRSDRAGLGDWYVDSTVWPEGLHPLVDHVHGLGMQFGLWVEPEMVSLDSELAAAHPDWILGPIPLGLSARNQYVLDVANPAARAYLLERLDSLVSEYGIDYLKWDHNRDLLEPVQRAGVVGRLGVHAQTLAVYALIDELRARHPALEIESCAAGGGRVDLGILQRTDRVWASDTNDPVERLAIQRFTSLLVAPEIVGSHVGAAHAHTTGRMTDLSFRLAVSLFAHAGIEWDITTCTPDELAALTRWAALYRELRGLLHSGAVVHSDLDDAETSLDGVVSPDGAHAVFLWARTGTSAAVQSGTVRFSGLDEARRYRVRVRTELGTAALRLREAPEWYRAALEGEVAVSGVLLGRVGLAMPTLDPAQAAVIELIG
jgi:alpha-galactosidase